MTQILSLTANAPSTPAERALIEAETVTNPTGVARMPQAPKEKISTVELDANGQKIIRAYVVMTVDAEGDRQLKGFQYPHLLASYLQTAGILYAGTPTEEPETVEGDGFTLTVRLLPRGINTDILRRVYEALAKEAAGTIVPAQAKFLNRYRYLAY